MRRLIRWLLNGLTVLSLLLCVATSVLWVRSFARMDCFRFQRLDGRSHRRWGVFLDCSGGGARLVLVTWDPVAELPPDPPPVPGGIRPAAPGLHFTHQQFHFAGSFPDIGMHGVIFDSGRWGLAANSDDEHRAVSLLFPLGAMALIASVPPLACVVRRVWKPRRTLPGHCRACGYDLRATPDRCPECGATTGAIGTTAIL